MDNKTEHQLSANEKSMVCNVFDFITVEKQRNLMHSQRVRELTAIACGIGSTTVSRCINERKQSIDSEGKQEDFDEIEENHLDDAMHFVREIVFSNNQTRCGTGGRE